MKPKTKRQPSATQSPTRWTRPSLSSGERIPRNPSRIEPLNPASQVSANRLSAGTTSPSPAGAGEGRGEGARASRSFRFMQKAGVRGKATLLRRQRSLRFSASPSTSYFLPYQSKFIRDPAPLVIVEKGRQVGLSYAAAYKAVRLVATHTAKLDVWVASRDEIQARQFLLACKRWAKTLNYAARAFQQKLLLGRGKSVQLQVLKFANGLCIYCLSSSPDAIVGKTGHVILDEFALHKDQRQLYAVAKPVTQWGGTLSIISTHRGIGTVFNELVTDARRHGNKMGWSLHTIPIQSAVAAGLVEKIDAATAGQWTERFKSADRGCVADQPQQPSPLDPLSSNAPTAAAPDRGGDSLSPETQPDRGCVADQPQHSASSEPMEARESHNRPSAAAESDSALAHRPNTETVSPSPVGTGEGRGEGARASRTLREFWLAQQRAECIDEEQWLQEYCCTPADESAAFITYDMIAACEDDAAQKDFAYLASLPTSAYLYIGFDVARTRDLSVIDVEEKVGDVYWERLRIELQGRTFAEQEYELRRLLDLPAMQRCCIDATGIGMQLAENMISRYGWRVEAVRFTGPVKEELAFPLRARHEDRTLRYARDEKLRADLRGIKKETTASGNLRFAGESADSHCDRFWAKALALHAGKGHREPGPIVAFDNTPQGRAIMDRLYGGILG